MYIYWKKCVCFFFKSMIDYAYFSSISITSHYFSLLPTNSNYFPLPPITSHYLPLLLTNYNTTSHYFPLLLTTSHYYPLPLTTTCRTDVIHLNTSLWTLRTYTKPILIIQVRSTPSYIRPIFHMLSVIHW